jgi:hypothetical protein
MAYRPTDDTIGRQTGHMTQCPEGHGPRSPEFWLYPADVLGMLVFLCVSVMVAWSFVSGLRSGRMWGIAPWHLRAAPTRYWIGQIGCGAVLAGVGLLLLILATLPACL